MAFRSLRRGPGTTKARIPKATIRKAGTFIQASRRVPSEEKAAFHDLTGAGRSQVLRPFLGLTPDDEDAIVDRCAAGLERALKES